MESLKKIDLDHIWHPFTPLNASPPLFITSASGVYLHTADGRKVIDAISSWWVNLHGHSNEMIAKAIARQASELEHVIFAGFTHAPATTLARNLLEILPSNQARIFFSDNGSTAVEVALKMAIQFWHNQGVERRTIIALDGAYHGDTFGAMSAGARGLFTDPFRPFLFEVEFVPIPEEGRENVAVDQLRALLKSKPTAAFIFEPLVQAAAGMRIYNAAALDEMIAVAKSQGAICIADEVFTGFGRTGKIFACDYLKNKPDIIALSKGITGGALPLGVTSCSTEIAAAFASDDLTKTFFHGHSYTANPLACAAANASFDLLRSNACTGAIRRISMNHAEFVKRMAGHPHVANARNLGTILAIEIQTDGKTGYDNSIRNQAYQYFLRHDILLRPLGNVIYVVPPYVITDEELEKVYRTISSFLESH